ncbi:MAG: peptidylprolyl isomerase [Alloprevotella sp.]|nr:peptidylprolyl isomerase [Alloprevotella sp.]
MNKYIKVAYSLYTISDDGDQELVERVSSEHPYQFITGFGMSLDAFEENICELEEGEEFNFVVPAAQAHGPYLEEHVLDLGKEIFSVDGHFDAANIYPGAYIPLMNEDGNRFQGLVKEVGDITVKVDLNHPLAGQTLQFKGKVLEAREATNKELEGVLNLLSGDECECGECGCGHHHDGDGHCGCGHHH